MERCRAHGITLSASKAQVGKEVKFAGFMVGCNCIRADPVKVEAISIFPAPKDLTNLKSYLDFANQLCKFCLPIIGAYQWGSTPIGGFKFKLTMNITSLAIGSSSDPVLWA